LREDEPLELLLLFLVVRPNPRSEIPPTGMSCGDPPTPMLWVKKEHLEVFVDPADDFPYNNEQSVTGILCAFQTNMFQVALSFKRRR
jgi:hypothetical protein